MLGLSMPGSVQRFSFCTFVRFHAIFLIFAGKLVNSSPVATTSKRSKQEEQFKLILEMISRQDWPGVLRLDELNRELTAGRVLGGFTAMQPHFPPTFKRVRDLAIDVAIHAKPDTESTYMFFNSKRLPSYTDRVLYKSLPGFAHRLTELGFESCENVCSSDHKPVRAYFLLTPTEGADGVQVSAPSFENHDRHRITYLVLHNVLNR